jgi:hypothetical protein
MKSIFLVVMVALAAFYVGSCKRIRKGVLEIRHTITTSITENFYRVELVEDGIYEPLKEFNLGPNYAGYYDTQTAFYWPDESAKSLGYTSKDESGSFSNKEGGKTPGKGGHWAPTTSPVTGGGGGGGGTGSGTTEILNVTVNGNSKDKQYRTFVVPSGVKKLTVTTKETPPDATWNETDLFVNEGTTRPTTNADPYTGYQAKKASLSNNRAQDVCVFDNPGAGTWTVMLYNYNSGYYASNLVVTIDK